jgi:hypothetical protein
MRKESDEFKGIVGRRVGKQPENETDHFYICPQCGQAVDMRELWQVFHHEDPDHQRHDVN